MSITNYLTFLRDQNGFYNFKELSKDMNINYSIVNGYLSETVQNISSHYLSYFLNYENRNRLETQKLKNYEVIYKSIVDVDQQSQISEQSLMYIAAKIVEGCSTRILFSNENKTYQFQGCYFKKSSGANFSVIDDWDSLKKEHWKNKYESVTKQPYTSTAYKDYDVFKNVADYYTDVLYFALQKCHSIQDKAVVNYDLILKKEDELHLIENIIPKKIKPKFSVIYVPIKEELKYEYVCHADKKTVKSISELEELTVLYSKILGKDLPDPYKTQFIQAAIILIENIFTHGELEYCATKLMLNKNESLDTDSLRKQIIEQLNDKIDNINSCQFYAPDYIYIIKACLELLSQHTCTEIINTLDSVKEFMIQQTK